MNTENTHPARWPSLPPDSRTDPRDRVRISVSMLATIVQVLADPSPTLDTDDPLRRDNTRRAGLAAQAVIHDAINTRQWSPGRSDAEVTRCVTSFLSGLRHLCDALGLDYHGLARDALTHYDRELRGEPI